MRKQVQPPFVAGADPLAPFNTADAVEYLNQLNVAAAAQLVGQVPDARGVGLLEQPELVLAPAILMRLPQERASALLVAMADDRAADLLLALEPPDRARLIAALPEPTQQALRGLMSHPAGTAGSLMTTEFVSVLANQRVEDVLQHVREVEHSRETIYAIYVLDPATRALLRVVTLRRLITSDPGASILDVAQANPPVAVAPDTDQEEVARLIRRHNLLAIPVLDRERRVVGIVTVDDVLDALIDESTEDVQRFGGVEALDRPYLQIGFGSMIRKRAGWLSVLFLGEMLTASAMQHYEDAVAKALVLTLFIPLIMSSGGNSGSQSTSLLIRSLALQEIRLRDWWRVALREVPTGLTLGSILGVLGFARIFIWQTAGLYDYGPHWMLVALTIAAALVGIVTFGSLTGAMLPFILQRLGYDPASASAPFVATLVDVSGLVIYFSIASVILGGTLL